jgi:hypothetical protein
MSVQRRAERQRRGRNTGAFILKPKGDTTDRMVGAEFEAGLASLKTIAEKTP